MRRSVGTPNEPPESRRVIERPDRVGQPTVNRDSREESGYLTIVKSVDVTALCPARRGSRRKVFLDYARNQEGVYVEITDCREGGDFGHQPIFPIAWLTETGVDDLNAVFVEKSKSFGLTPNELMVIILGNVP